MSQLRGSRLWGVAIACIFASGCTMGLHGSFIAHSWAGEGERASAQLIGDVEGRSCQTRVFYVFGTGEPATTDGAIIDAKSKHPGTAFLADISIDDEVQWYFPYSVQCIVVRADAYR
jgi:hypothetical protein